jgi:intracellular multiplication protein IcmK
MKIPYTLSAVGLLLSALSTPGQAATPPTTATPPVTAPAPDWQTASSVPADPAPVAPQAAAVATPPAAIPAQTAPQAYPQQPATPVEVVPSGTSVASAVPAPSTGPVATLPPAPPAAPQVSTTTQAAAGTPATDITAPLRDSTPLPPPQSGAAVENYAIGQVAPLTREQIQSVGEAYDQTKRGRAWQAVRVVPHISGLTVNLTPGASLPVLRTAPGQTSSVTFTDSTGAPWKLAAPPFNGNNRGFYAAWIPDSNILVVQALRQYDTGSITVYLAGLSVPVVLNATSGEPDNPSGTQVVDSRLDLRIPRRGPSARALPEGESKIGLYDSTLQAFLDGTPPKDARRLKVSGGVPDTEVWQQGDDLFIRTRSELRDEFEQTLSSGDGTTLYRLPATPYLTFSVDGKTQSLTLNLE